MMNTRRNYCRTREELERVASKFWPAELSELEAKASVLPLLLKTQEQFINIISIGSPTLDDLFAILQHSGLAPNLFVKHLVILADYGGEMLQRVSNEFENLFPERQLLYRWRGELQRYTFKALPQRRLSNKTLKIDGKELLVYCPLNEALEDAIMLLLFGNAHCEHYPEAESALSKCIIGEYLGKSEELRHFIKQRYLWVSRITAGATSNSLGQLAQQFVAQYIKEHLTFPNLIIQHSGRLPGVTHTDDITGRLTAFDVIVTNGSKYVAIEVCFQVTTNSVIERKAGQARSRYEQIERAGHRIAYVLDGAGNFQRETALQTICAYSHCTVAFSRSELEILCTFLNEQFEEA